MNGDYPGTLHIVERSFSLLLYKLDVFRYYYVTHNTYIHQIALWNLVQKGLLVLVSFFFFFFFYLLNIKSSKFIQPIKSLSFLLMETIWLCLLCVFNSKRFTSVDFGPFHAVFRVLITMFKVGVGQKYMTVQLNCSKNITISHGGPFSMRLYWSSAWRNKVGKLKIKSVLIFYLFQDTK